MENGVAAAGYDHYVGSTNTSQECIELVITNEPMANGITWGKGVKGDMMCRAKFGATHIDSDACVEGLCKTCIFGGRLMRWHVMITLY